ncbi:thiamine-phosphate kinase [Paenarthrobacter nitroguajacolicus]|uniref:Thiamine-monophosphate kinase n=1 Tax=Paenarthrobacter nitroguajacolicus TaxID=211146 RepID=A0A558H268_PAENT|nr:thiamine-phosphate kinase [Paenarthrobacter nitroguajacolicus]TVU63220.1 thiamine-phosphate kinase [Paenarthrobacter nitroguajacolicus]
MPAEQLTVQDLSESELLARIFPRLNHSPGVLLGPGDDAALIAAPDGRTLISIDTQTQDQDFRLDWNNGYQTSGYDVGWKAAAQNLSDINAMGGSATSLVVSLTMPPVTPVEWVEAFADGLTAAIIALGAPDCSVAGGDLGRGRELAVTVAVVGTLDGLAPVLRSGAKPGDTIAVAGTLGRAAAGWALLESDIRMDSLSSELRGLVESQCRPVPPLAAGPAAARVGATAMLDISDGLLRDASRLAGASDVVLDFDPVALKVHALPLEPAAARLGVDAMPWVLGGGEDHGLLATFPAGIQLPQGFTAIGSVQAVVEPPGSGVRIAGQAADTVGWDHFAD